MTPIQYERILRLILSQWEAMTIEAKDNSVKILIDSAKLLQEENYDK